jgi:hypothetical protein
MSDRDVLHDINPSIVTHKLNRPPSIASHIDVDQ